MKILLNGQVKESHEIELDAGYFYGYGAFETILVKNGKGILVQEHINRLNDSLKFLEVQKELTKKNVEYAIDKLECNNTALKVNVSDKNVVFSTRELIYTDEQYDKGARLKLSKVLRNPTSPSVNIKSMNYLDNIIELKKAKDEGYQDVLFMNYRNEVCETAIANLFIIKGNKLYTPSLESGLLNGIIRQWVINHYKVFEMKMELKDVLLSDGAFITNSLMGIMKVAGVGKDVLKDNPLITKIKTDYDKFIKEQGE